MRVSMSSVSAHSMASLPQVGPRLCHDKKGYSTTKAFLYKIAYTPSFNNEKTLQLSRCVQGVVSVVSLLLVLSIPPCSTCLKKLALLVNIIPSWALEPIKTSLKILVGTPIAIATLAVVYMYTLLRQKKYQVALGAIIAIRALASLYLKASQVTIDEHNAQLKNAIELASKATPREFFKLLMDIQAVEESNGRPISSEAISILLNKYITSLPREISREEFAGKMHDVLSYLSTSLTQTNNATPQFLQSLCILHTQSHTQNPFLTLSLLETTESLLENTESLLAKTKDIS